MFWTATGFRLFVALGLFVAQSHTGPDPAVAPPDQRGPGQPQQITVKIRNGKTGRPIWFASPFVFLGEPDPKNFEASHRRTKWWSDAHVDVSGVTPREVRVWIDFIHRDCRFAEGDNRFRAFDFGGNTLNGIGSFDLNTILSTGIVAPNMCSTKAQHPEPGVLMIYVIPASFKELWDS
jgi:hypothetical protein